VEGGQGVVVGMTVAGDITKGQRVVGGPLDLATGEGARGVAVDQHTQQHGRRVGVTATPGIGPFQGGQVLAFHHIDDIARQVGFRQPLLHRGR